MSTKIYVMTHKKFKEPREPVYIPLHVGRAVSEELGYLGDNTGNHISEKNKYYSELTGLYWVAQNVKDADYLGLCHYRRFFLNEEGRLLNEKEYEEALRGCDILLPRATGYDVSYYEVYKEAHNIKDLIATGEALRRLYPEDYPIFEEVIAGKKVYSGNLFVTSGELFCEYAGWLFSIFDIVERKIDVETYDAYHKRVFGFLSEQLLYVWVKSRGLKIAEKPVGITQEKAETLELKQQLRQCLSEGTPEGVKKALGLFRENMKERPDLTLQASDLSGELEDMFRVLYICEKELEQGKNGMLAITRDLDVLVKHYRLIGMIVLHTAQGKATPEEMRYFRDARVSGVLLEIIINTNPLLKPVEKELFSVLSPV